MPGSARTVLLRARQACLSGLRLRSDRQPRGLRVDNRPHSNPAIWLHAQPPETAWVIVDIGERDWCKLAYQFGHEFGHEFGHVLCNSWQLSARPRPPCQWLEEALVEAFSLRGLARLAEAWAQDPPFRGDGAFAGAIREYRAHVVASYARVLGGEPDVAAWFRGKADALGTDTGLNVAQGPAVLAFLAALEADSGCVEDMGALNRWPARSAAPLGEYPRLGSSSYGEIGTPDRLPEWLRHTLSP